MSPYRIFSQTLFEYTRRTEGPYEWQKGTLGSFVSFVVETNEIAIAQMSDFEIRRWHEANEQASEREQRRRVCVPVLYTATHQCSAAQLSSAQFSTAYITLTKRKKMKCTHTHLHSHQTEYTRIHHIRYVCCALCIRIHIYRLYTREKESEFVYMRVWIEDGVCVGIVIRDIFYTAAWTELSLCSFSSDILAVVYTAIAACFYVCLLVGWLAACLLAFVLRCFSLYVLPLCICLICMTVSPPKSVY